MQIIRIMGKMKYYMMLFFTVFVLRVNAQLEINGSSLTETRMYAYGNNISRYWAMNGISSYGFGIDAYGIGHIWSNINGPTLSMLSFTDSWINGFNFLYGSFGHSRENRFHYSNTPSFGEAFGFDFNPDRNLGLVIENANGEGSGLYFDSDFIALWSPGDCNRLLRIYDEDGMVEKAYIDSYGNYVKNSDRRRKENIKKLNSISALEGIKKLNGVKYNFKSELKEYEAPELLEEKVNGKTVNVTTNEVKEKNNEAKKYYGFIAQEVEEVFPEVVSTDQNGYKFMDYTEVVPILVEAIKELAEELNELKIKNGSIKYLKTTNLGYSQGDGSELVIRAELYQNSPNPFKENTEIKYYLPENVTSAAIYIYDMQGRQIKSVPVSEGTSSIIIDGADLYAGMYFYSLIVDGKEIDTKRMILTE